MKKVKNIIYTCKQATFLIEKKQITRLTIREKLELKLHLAGCSVCKLFQRQSIMINRQIKNHFHLPSREDHTLDDEYKKTLQEQIEEKLK